MRDPLLKGRAKRIEWLWEEIQSSMIETQIPIQNAKFPRGEILLENDLYGNASIVRAAYDNFMDEMPLIIPHGVHWDGSVWLREINIGLPVLVFSSEHLRFVSEVARRKKKRVDVILHTHPFRLLCELFQVSQEWSFGRKERYLMVLPHGTQRNKVSFDEERIIEIIESTGLEKKNIDVLVHSNDYICLERIFTRNQISVKCLGDKYDPRYLARFIKLVSGYKRVYSIGLGSALHFSAQLGLECWVSLNPFSTTSKWGAGSQAKQLMLSSDREVMLIKSLREEDNCDGNVCQGEFFRRCNVEVLLKYWNMNSRINIRKLDVKMSEGLIARCQSVSEDDRGVENYFG